MIRLRCGDEERQATIRSSPAGLEVTVDGQAFALEVREVAPGTFALRQGDRSETFHCVRDGDRIHLFWRGVAYGLIEEREGARAAQRHHGGGLEAPMPGKVIKICVAPGQTVAKGQEVEVQTGILAGATEYLLKPFAPDQLTRRVAEILERNKPTP